MSNSAEALARTAPREDDPTPIRRRGERPHGNARRVLLLQTTLRLIADEGIDAVSHRSVAEAAGVPLGSTTYWFSSRQDMLRQALEYFARLEIETLQERLGAVLGRRLSRTPARRRVHRSAGATAGRGSAGGRSRSTRSCRRRPASRSSSRSAASGRPHGTRPSEEVFSSLGAPDPGLEARMFLAMLDGVLLEQLAAPDRGSGGERHPPRASRLVRPRSRESEILSRRRPGGRARRLCRDRCARRPAEAAAAIEGSGGGATGHPTRRRRASPAAISRSRTGRSTSTRRRFRTSSRRRDQRPLHRGHQQLRRVLRKDAAAALPGPVRRPVADGGD